MQFAGTAAVRVSNPQTLRCQKYCRPSARTARGGCRTDDADAEVASGMRGCCAPQSRGERDSGHHDVASHDCSPVVSFRSARCHIRAFRPGAQTVSPGIWSGRQVMWWHPRACRPFSLVVSISGVGSVAGGAAPLSQHALEKDGLRTVNVFHQGCAAQQPSYRAFISSSSCWSDSITFLRNDSGV